MDSLFSDFDSLSESSSSEDQDEMESLYGGRARTIFSSLEETIEKIDDFLLFERVFMHGDIVCMVSEPLKQMGKVVNVDITVDLENIHGCKIQNVNSKNLQKIRSVSGGDHVVLGSWLGKVEKIVDRLTVLLDDGTKCELSSLGPEKITVLSPDLIDDPQYPFYPGLRVQIESSSVSKSTGWLCGIRKDKLQQGTICNVDAGFLYVDWLCCAVINGETRPAPPCLQDSKNLSVLSCFPHASWQLGDWCVIPTDEISPRKRPETTNFQQIGVIVKTKTKVDVQWQDGSQSLGLDSHLLFPVNIIDVHDFWPDSFVLENGTVDDSQVQERWGFVRSVDSKERTVKVKWLDSDEEADEIVSAYELVEHPDYTYCLGEAVFRTDKNVDVKVENGEEMTENLNDNFLSCFGTVIGFNNGEVVVKWATGATSKVAPYEIYRVDKCEGTTATSVLGDDDVQSPNEELPLKNQSLGQELKDVLGLNYDNTKNSSSASISQFAIGVFTSLTSTLFGSLGTSLISAYRCTSQDGQILGNPSEEDSLELCNSNMNDQLPLVDDFAMPEKITPAQNKEVYEDETSPFGNEQSETFRRFDMVNDCSDHHFSNGSGTDLQSTQVKRGWLKKVHQEWSILEKDLPETIYVHVYEERMDLLRAAILGTDGTPYHDGLFFFDIHLPPQYPDEPPMVHYNSGGLRLNPNLYESGKVCLSLLNTWTGSQSESWNPGTSTILQVLLSLQALVLNEKPYFNEAGYDTQIGKAEGEKNSISYNENAFLVNCRSMLYLIRKPPKHFEALVEEHFSRRCGNILLACKAYMEGAPVGYPFVCGNPEREIRKGSSTGFKIMLGKLFPRLVEAFSDKGIDCSNFLD
ncbi:hypothetical protein BUALT_Bualt18G0111000 [Buddleja alternifolia]|uniref:E2 ubiquitin-conjugating enzyme n=1 Tax=Buddleja alternifolia TaxID=168488 RepID=A0AAV6WAL5_9LAMI|nr:hypothetical protein BUALT_Bualt18G0111000 [Buddleja alternifolia]